MESIRIKKEDTYKIEVNDNGEYIEFDLLDIDLAEKIQKFAKEIVKQDELYNKKMLAYEKQYKDNKNLLYEKKHEADITYFNTLRKGFDSIAGENASLKTFGKINRFGMFNQLFEELEPHFSKMEIQVSKIKDKLVEKYMPKEDDTL